MPLRQTHLQAIGQVLEFTVGVFLDGQSRVRHGFVQKCPHIADHRFDLLQHFDGELFHFSMSFAEFRKGFGGVGERFPNTDGGEHFAECSMNLTMCVGLQLHDIMHKFQEKVFC